MSLRYKGAVLSATPPTVNADGFGNAKGIWTMQQQYQYEGSGTWPSPFTPEYVEDVFSTYLYTGTGATLAINNGIDLATEGGLVWFKDRLFAEPHRLFDTLRGTNKSLSTNLSNAQTTSADISSYNTNGFTLPGSSNVNYDPTNPSEHKYASWTFRKAEKFFDVVTYTGDGAVSKNISHNLGSVPGCIVVKCTSTTHPWRVYHRSLGNTKALALNSTDSEYTNSTFWNNTTPTSTVFTVGESAFLNQSGQTYVAYLFAHDAGGFGDNGTDSIVNCGSFTTNSSGVATVNLGWEPQWILVKKTGELGHWFMLDSMRGWAVPIGSTDAVAFQLRANLSNAEASTYLVDPTSTGFVSRGAGDTQTYIYIAIRRGPMKTPTDATKVFNTLAASSGNPQFKNVGFPVDLAIAKERTSGGWYWGDRIRGEKYLKTENANAEADLTGYFGLDYSNGAWDDIWNGYHGWMFRRAPKFMDVVAYTGTGANLNVTHSLGAVPELVIVKSRDAARSWCVYDAANGNGNYMLLNSTQATGANSTFWNNTTPTSSVFTVGTSTNTNTSGEKYIAYLFASLSGISKIGSVSISSSGTLNVDCGFTNGARFVMLKRSSDTSDWLIFDTVRGIVAGNDPYVAFNSTSAENFHGANDNIDPYSAGFSIPMSTFSNLYGTGTYIYLAIA